MPVNKNIKLTLLENADSFACEGIRCAVRAEQQPEEWKFAILHIVQSIELALKEILRREHKSLIYDDVDKQKHTVSLSQALTRIPKVSDISFNENDIRKLNEAVSIRHRFTHSDVEYGTIQMKLVFVEMLGFLQHCYLNYLGKKLDDFVPVDLWKKAINIEEYTRELYKRAREKFAKEGTDEGDIYRCPRCYCESFYSEKNECYVCGHKDDTDHCVKCGRVLFCSDCDDYIFDSDSKDSILCMPCADAMDYGDYLCHFLKEEGKT